MCFREIVSELDKHLAGMNVVRMAPRPMWMTQQYQPSKVPGNRDTFHTRFSADQLVTVL